MQHGAYRAGDRQVDAVAVGLAHHFIRRLHRLDHLADLADRVLQRLAATQGQAQAAVAREVAGTRQHQIAQAGQAHQGFRLGADGGRQAQHLVEAAGDQACARVETQLHAVGHAGGHGQHVLHRAAELGPHHVVAGIGAERGAMHHVGHGLREHGIGAMHGHRGGQAQRDFLGERRTGDDGQRYVGTQDVFGHLMQETAGAGLEALGGPRDARARGTQRRQLAQRFGEGVRRHHHQHLVGALERGFQIGGGAQRERQRDTGQVARVLVLRVDRCGDHGIATPQGDGVAMPRHQRGQRRAPRPGTQHRDLQRCACLQISHPSPLCEASPP